VSPRGRRPGAPDTRAAIVDAARPLFAELGLSGTSMRKVAAEAGVDPALVHHYFDSKEDLFLAALAVPFDPRVLLAAVADGGPDGAGERLITTFLSIWDREENRLPLLAIARGVLEPGGQRLVKDGFLGIVVVPVVRGLGVDQPERRAALVASQVVGLVLARYVLELEPLASADAATLVPTYAPVFQHYLTGDLP
jgi:AcrR family transcriptional regulator